MVYVDDAHGEGVLGAGGRGIVSHFGRARSKAKRFSDLLYDEEIFMVPIVFPMVAQDLARIRVQMNAKITIEQLDSNIKTIEAT